MLRTAIVFLILLFPSFLASQSTPSTGGPFTPDWNSLSRYKAPEWFRDAKFGIWAHWGPQCQPEQGDWYARGMYEEGSGYYNWHVKNYGHPSVAGFKDVIHAWKAEQWDPDSLVRFYKRVGAKYFFALANHHDNFDLWDSKYQPWNSVNMGPKKDIIAGWEKAARENGLPFGVSIHAAHAWTWYEPSQSADSTGPNKGVPYDGRLTKEEGKGTWWEGYDPQALYEQQHPKSVNNRDIGAMWDWGNGAARPSEDYGGKFYRRTIDLIDRVHPDLIYFDDTALPLYPVSNVGLKIAAEYYNGDMQRHNGKLNGVIFGKILTPEQKQCMVWDVERGAPDKIQELPWQTCSCIGGWHYDRRRYEEGRYKSAKEVIQMLVDIVSKNGNLLLNIPVRGNGTIDEKEVAVLQGIAAWMDINKESIYGTRPWFVFGEGPVADAVNPLNAQGFNEGKAKYSALDIRFNKKGNILFATVMGVPQGSVTMKELGKRAGHGIIRRIEIVGSSEPVKWEQGSDLLVIQKPATVPDPIALVYKLTMDNAPKK